MAGHRTLTHADKIAIRRFHLQHPTVPKAAIGKRLKVSRASIYRVTEEITRSASAPEGAYPELREAYIAESGDHTELGWAHVWIASLEVENELLNAALEEATDKLLGVAVKVDNRLSKC